MKNLLRTLIYLSCTALFVLSCQKDDGPRPGIKNNVVFSFEKATDHQTKSSTGLKSANAIEDAAAVVVSIQDAAGNLVYDMEQVELVNMNGSFISKPLSLLTGDYELTLFIVVDADGNALYASPQVGSEKAYLVEEPLPIPFTVNKDEVTKLTPEVLDTEESQPEDFGYSTFSFDVVETFDFLISVFAYNETEENYELTTADLNIQADGSTIYSKQVEAITDTVTVNDGYVDYILEVTKAGYETYVDTFSNSELRLYFSSDDNGPLMVVLEEEQLAMGQPCPDAPTVTDADGNVYETVQIGDQCWMAENLNVGAFIDTSITSQSDNNLIERYCYNNNVANCDTFGGLYTWNEAMGYDTISGSQGICPDGWHIPTYEEVQLLEQNFNIDYFNKEYGGVYFPLNNGFRKKDVLATYFMSEDYGGSIGGIVVYGDIMGGDNTITFFHQLRDIYANGAASIRCIKD